MVSQFETPSHTDQLVLIGDGETAEIAFDYFTNDSPWNIAAFCVEPAFRTRDELFGLPVIDLDDLQDRYPRQSFAVHVAISSTHLNRSRKRLYLHAKNLGYHLATYVSSQAFSWRDVAIGENCFIFEGNTLQRGVEIGNNVLMWCGNQIGHRTIIGDHVFFAMGSVVSGFCRVGDSSFLGANCTLADYISLPHDTVVGAGAVLPKSIAQSGRVLVGNPARFTGNSSYTVFSVPNDEL